MERYEYRVIKLPEGGTLDWWVVQGSCAQKVCRAKDRVLAARIAALLNADAARQNGDDLPACPVCHGSGCRLKDAPAADPSGFRSVTHDSEAEMIAALGREEEHSRPWLTGYGMDEGRDEFDAYETWLEERSATLVAVLHDEGINLRVDLFTVMCDLADRQPAPAADPWPEVPEPLDLWGKRGPEYAYCAADHDETRRTVNALVACVGDLQRRLGKEDK